MRKSSLITMLMAVALAGGNVAIAAGGPGGAGDKGGVRSGGASMQAPADGKHTPPPDQLRTQDRVKDQDKLKDPLKDQDRLRIHKPAK